MKNLLIYTNPSKKFDDEGAVLAKIQIDNSISLGWKKEDILFFTDFPYEYNGIKSIIIPDEQFCAVRPRSINTSIIPYLVEQGIIEKDKLYWNHNFDAYQLDTIEEQELGLENVDIGLTDYGWRDRWCMGSFFFKDSSKDIFQSAKDIIYTNIEDETAMMQLSANNTNNINERSKRLNITYNVGKRNVAFNYEKATKPLKVLHFHPADRRLLDIFMYGKNEMNIPLMPTRLIEIFNYHGMK